MKFFPSRWPIMCAVMNQVSNLNLALAVHEAGAMPGLQIKDRYHNDGSINCDLVHDTLREFTKSTGSNNLVLAMSEEDLFDYNFIKIVRDYKVSHVEILSNQLDNSQYWHQKQFHLGLYYIKKTAKVMIRLTKPTNSMSQADAFCIKGQESAGFAGSVSVADLFDQQRAISPTPLIPYGGIATPIHVRNFLDRGAAGVAVGTLFSATTESCLSHATKLAMCSANSAQITQFKPTGQNALLLGDLESPAQDWNHEHDLSLGLKGQGGLIYAGSAIDHVNEIRTVKQVVDYLTSEL